MIRFVVIAVLALAACGIDGPPVRPTPAEPGVSVSGHGIIGVATDG